MDAAAHVEQLSPIAFLLRAGGSYGLLLLALGLVLALWGLINLLLVRNRTVQSLQALLSLVPALLAVAGVYSSYMEFVQMAVSPEPPKPAEFGRVVSFAMACGILGPLATVIPAGFGIFALARNAAPTAGSSASASEI